MRILVTGAAGFIGSALVIKLLNLGYEVLGIDNHNDYYNTELKEARILNQKNHPKYQHFRIDISDTNAILDFFKKNKPQCVVNLAAQAGVRYSLKNPITYINSNILGFVNILEGCRHNKVDHFIYASSSSVYGANTRIPFSVKHNVDHPISLYAATKKSNELLSHSYSYLYDLPTTGLRFFTVYGPWDRPDMALQKFAHAIMNKEEIKIYNNGNHKRDFTYIDDVVEGIVEIINIVPNSNFNWSSQSPDPNTSSAPWRIYNIGNNFPINLIDYITLLEKKLGQKAMKKFLPIQPGDVTNTWADLKDFSNYYMFKPKTSLEEGISHFVKWFKNYYKY